MRGVQYLKPDYSLQTYLTLGTTGRWKCRVWKCKTEKWRTNEQT